MLCQHATYSTDRDNNVIVGLPPPREGWVTARSYGLEESLAERALHVRLMSSCFDLLPELFIVVSKRAHERRRSCSASQAVSCFVISQGRYRLTTSQVP